MASSTAPIDLRNPGRTIHAGVILLNSETEVLDVAPMDLLHSVSKKFVQTLGPILPPGAAEQALDIQFHWVNETGKLGELTAGIKVEVTDTFKTSPNLDIVLMGAADLAYDPTEAELAFIRKAYDSCAAFLCICAGMAAPLRAGIFAGKTATAPRFMLDGLKKDAQNVNWVEKRWCRDGKLWTSGTLLNGQDLMRAFGTETWGRQGKGEEGLMEMMLDLGDWPVRNVDYAEAFGGLRNGVKV